MKKTEIITEPCRLAFASLFQAAAKHPTTPDKTAFQATLLLPPSMSLEPFKLAMTTAMQEKWKELKKFTGNSMPLKKCDGKQWAGFEPGWRYLKASSQFAPQVVDQRRQEVIDTTLVYAGCWCRFYIACYAWDNAAGEGLSFSLNAVQLVREDARLDGRKKAEDVFSVIDTGEDDAPPPASNADMTEIFD